MKRNRFITGTARIALFTHTLRGVGGRWTCAPRGSTNQTHQGMILIVRERAAGWSGGVGRWYRLREAHGGGAAGQKRFCCRVDFDER